MTILHISPTTALEYGTPMFNADETDLEWELSEILINYLQKIRKYKRKIKVRLHYWKT